MKLSNVIFRPAQVLLLSALALLSGCGFWRFATVPLQTRLEAATCQGQPRTLLVMLPGRYSYASEFEREGFVRALREHKLAADMLLVDAHLGYYQNGSITERLHHDVLVPARAQGYQRIWLVGISLGGLGALLQADSYPQDVDGIVVLAPYLGEPRLSEEIAASGGLEAWQPPQATPGIDAIDEPVKRAWRWLQTHTGQNFKNSNAEPPLYLGYGSEDRFAYSHQLLAKALPAARVFTTPGGHDWPQWARLWSQMLNAIDLPLCPA